MSRLEPDTRKAEILAAAMTLARQHGYRDLTRNQIAEEAGCSPGLVTRYYYAMPLLLSEVLTEAVRLEELDLVAQGLVHGEPAAWAAPAQLRARAAMRLMRDL